jgi:8-oxo-dGTP pyrophosphatase MutT (NUDIX family)
MEPPVRRPGGVQRIPRPDAWRPGGAAPWSAATQNGQPPATDRIAEAVARRAPQPLSPAFVGARNSAVLVLLHEGDDGAELLFTRRPMHMRNHRGEISFPGGRMDAGESPANTALREAWEEVALDPQLVTVHGELDHISTLVSQSYIVPVVATVAQRPVLRPHVAEVDRILWVSLADLIRPGTFFEEVWGTPPLDRQIYFFELDDETVWGATARMVHQLLRLAHEVDEPEPPTG